MSRLSADDIRVCIQERGHRLWVAWSGPAFMRVRDSFRAMFPSPVDARWVPEERAWSMPLTRRQRLKTWLSQQTKPDHR